MAAKSDPVKAQERANILWQHYRQYGRLMIADIKQLIGVQCDALYKTFQYNGIEAPPIWNSQAEKVKRKARILTDEAERLGQSSLTKSQAGKVLGIKASRVGDIMTQIAKRGYSAPEIVDEVEDSIKPTDSISFQMTGIVNPSYHPAGLQVLDHWSGPGDKVTYLLR
jgi:predicted XRE-type DNA-binding protein